MRNPTLSRRASLFCLLAATPGLSPLAADGNRDAAVYSVVAVMLLVVIAFLAFLWLTQRRFLDACQTGQQLELFQRSPAGLPEGTIRGTMGLLIVLVSLLLVLLPLLTGSEQLKVPEMLTGILGSVIGFYFGSRGNESAVQAAVAAAAPQAAVQVKEIRQQLDQATQVAQTNDATRLLDKTQAVLRAAGVVIDLLPGEQGQTLRGASRKLEQGIAAVRALTANDPAGALAKAQELFAGAEQADPLKEVIGRAAQSVAPLLARAIPGAAPVALLGSVLGIGLKLAGDSYQKWKARVLDLPISPVIFAFPEVDSNTGYSMIENVPALRQAFEARLADNDREFLAQFARDLLSAEVDADTLRERYGAGFETPAAFDDALEQARRVALDRQLEARIQGQAPALLAPAGSYGKLVGALDQIGADERARTDLDQAVLVVEGLQNAGLPVADMLQQTLEEASK